MTCSDSQAQVISPGLVEVLATEGAIVSVDVTAVDFSIDAVIEDVEVKADGAPINVLVEMDGLPGPPGPPGSGGQASHPSAINISAQRVVFLDEESKLRYADKDVPEHLFRIAGISINSALAGADAEVQAEGLYEYVGWSWTPSLPIFLESNGFLTQMPPATGSLVVIAGAVSETKILIRIGRPIRRS